MRTATRNGILVDADPKCRRVTLFDAENVVGNPDGSPEEFLRAWRYFLASPAGYRPGDLVFVGCSSHAARIAVPALWSQPIRWCVRDGVDGADDALLDAVDIDYLSRRFGTFVVASGDHAFAPVAARARALGMQTHQVTGRGLSSRVLRAACHIHTQLRLDEAPALSLAA